MKSLSISPKHPVAAEHVIDGLPCWPVAAYVAHMIDVCLTTSLSRCWLLQDFSAIRPLFVDRNIYLYIENNTDDRITVRMSDSDAHYETIPASECARAFCSSTTMSAPTYLSLNDLRASHNHIVPIKDFEIWQHESNIVYGELYQLQHELWSNNTRTAILSLVNADTCGQFNQTSPFRIHPSLIDTLFQQLGFLAGSQTNRLMPWFIKEVRFAGPVSGPLFAHTMLTDASDHNIRGSSRLINPQGEILLELEGIVLRTDTQIKEARISKEFECLCISWEPSSPPISPLQQPQNPFVIKLSPAISADNLAQQLYKMGRHLIEISKRPEDTICVVGRQVHNVLADDRPDPVQAALWAWYLVARQEFRQININLIDIDTLEPTSAQISAGFSECAYRNDQVFLPTMIPTHAITKKSFSIENCLITGGIGDLGLIAANVLADLGIVNLWLVSRSASEHKVDQTTLASLRAKTNVHIIACDIADIESSLPQGIPLDLIIHTAGVVEDSLIATATEDRIVRVLHPKVTGVAAVYQLAAAHNHPKVILFSSIASTNGRPGQSTYAAANAFIDAYAANCRADGLHWYSLQWGLWNAGVGIPIVEMISNNDYPFLTPKQGALALKYVLTKLPANTYRIIAKSNKSTHSINTQVIDPHIEPTHTNLEKTKGRRQPMKLLLETIATVLRLDHVDPMDSPIDLGLDSIMAVEITSILGKQGINIDPGAFFEITSLAELEERTSHTNLLKVPPIQNIIDRDPLIHNESDSLANATHMNSSSRPIDTKQTMISTYPSKSHYELHATKYPQIDPTHINSTTISRSIDPKQQIAPIYPSKSQQQLHSARLFRPTLPSRLIDAVDARPLEAVIDHLSKVDRTLVANGDYFYEPVIQRIDRARVNYNHQWHLNMASYSYLGLIGHPFIEQAAIDAIDRFSTGAHGVRLLAGTMEIHRKLESTIAKFHHSEDAIVFSSGYMANVATIASLVGSGDIVISDMLNHASIVDGCLLSGANMQRYRHNDMNDLERILTSISDKTRTRLVVSDAVFSMDGDIAPLPDLIQVCQRYGAILMIDEAHSLGVLGATGRGICEYFNVDPELVDVKMGTLSKTIPSTGGYICGSRNLIFALKNNARGWMFSAAITPAQAAAATAAFEVIDQSPFLVAQLQERIRFYRKLIAEANFSTLGTDTPIVPIMTHTDGDAIRFARHSQSNGLFVQPITYPTVPRNAPRLRTIVTLDHSIDDLQEAVSTLQHTITRKD